MFSCCWTPVIRSSRSTILFKFGSKVPLKEPSNLSLSLSKGLRRFRSCKRGLDSFELTSRYLSTLVDSSKQRAATTRHGIIGKLACYEEILKEKKRVLSRHSSLFDSSHLQRIVHRYLDGWTLGMMIQKRRLQFKGSGSSWNCFILFFFVNFS